MMRGFSLTLADSRTNDVCASKTESFGDPYLQSVGAGGACGGRQDKVDVRRDRNREPGQIWPVFLRKLI